MAANSELFNNVKFIVDSSAAQRMLREEGLLALEVLN